MALFLVSPRRRALIKASGLPSTPSTFSRPFGLGSRPFASSTSPLSPSPGASKSALNQSNPPSSTVKTTNKTSPKGYRSKYEIASEAVRSALARADPDAALSSIREFYEGRSRHINRENEFRRLKESKRNKAALEADVEVKVVEPLKRGEEVSASNLAPTLYNRVIAYYSEKRNVEGAVKVFNLAKANPMVALDAFSYAGVIAACARAGQLMPAYKFFQEMLRARIQPDIVIFNTLLRACGSEAVIAQKLWKSMVESKIQPDSVSYSSLIHSFAEAKLFNKARLAFREMVEAKIKPTAYTYAALIRAAGLAKDWRRAFDYIAESKAVEPNLPLYRAIMLTYATLRDSFRAKAYFDSLPENLKKDEAIVASLIKAHVGVGSPDKVRALWTELSDLGFPLSPAAYASAIYAFCELDDLDFAWNILSEARSRKVALESDIFLGFLATFAKAHQVHSTLGVLDLMVKDGAALTPRLYNFALQACQEYDSNVEKVMAHMRSHGVKLDVVGYNILINLSAQQKEGGKDRALRLYYTLRQDELQPTFVTFNTLIKACGDSGDVHEVARLVAEMDELKVKADPLTYRAILRAYGTDGERALQTLRKMRRIGMEADASCYAYAMQALKISSRHADVVALYDELVKAGIEPFAEIFGITAASYLALHEIEKAFGVVQTMKERGLAPTERIAAILLAGAAVPQGDAALVERVLAFVQSEGIPFGETLYDALLEFYAFRGNKTRVMELFEEMSSKSLRRSKQTWRSLFRVLEGDPKLIAKFYSLMVEDGVSLNAYLCNQVVDALLHVGNVTEAYSVYEKCLKEGIRPKEQTVSRLLKAHEALKPVAKKTETEKKPELGKDSETRTSVK